VTWNIEKDGGFKGGIEGLDLKGARGSQYRVLRYTIQMKFTELVTMYWVKVWPSAKMKARTKNPMAFISFPETCKASFTPQEISRSLAESFKLEDDEGQEPSQQENQPANTSGPVNPPQSDQASSVTLSAKPTNERD